MAKSPVRVAVTGAAGQIGYSLLFRIASGEMLGKDQPVILQLLDLPQGQKALNGVMMELTDCAFPLLAGMIGTDNPDVAFKDAQVALLVGAKPRGPGMERKDLLTENGKIFIGQGDSIGRVADPNCKVLVVGNPCNTNCYIAMKSAIKHNRVKAKNFTAMLASTTIERQDSFPPKLAKRSQASRRSLFGAITAQPCIRTFVSPLLTDQMVRKT